MIKPSGKIGVFDSGLGGLAILKEMAGLMPEREYSYLGDNLRAPYGDKSQDKIFEHTLAGVEWLFADGAEIVVLACNTASANALRRIQCEVLPVKYPEKKVLGIIIPTVEVLGNSSRTGHIGVLATSATVESGVFEKEVGKYNSETRVVCQSGGQLAELIERDGASEALAAEIKNVTDRLIGRDKLIDTVILGCTHYALIAGQIRAALPPGIKAVGQGGIVAAKLRDYLDRHDEIRGKLKDGFSISFHTTSGKDEVKKLMARFYGQDIAVSSVEYRIK